MVAAAVQRCSGAAVAVLVRAAAPVVVGVNIAWCQWPMTREGDGTNNTVKQGADVSNFFSFRRPKNLFRLTGLGLIIT